MILKDGNSAADSLGGNPLPQGTTAVFSIDGGGASVKGLTTYTVVNGTSPEATPALGVTVATDTVDPTGTLPANVFLRLTINAPGLTTLYQWPIVVTR